MLKNVQLRLDVGLNAVCFKRHILLERILGLLRRLYPFVTLCSISWPGHHDDVIKWKQFPRYWPFVRGIHRSPVNSPHKGQWRGALMLCLICAWINGWVNNRETGDLRRHRAHYDVIVMMQMKEHHGHWQQNCYFTFGRDYIKALVFKVRTTSNIAISLHSHVSCSWQGFVYQALDMTKKNAITSSSEPSMFDFLYILCSIRYIMHIYNDIW